MCGLLKLSSLAEKQGMIEKLGVSSARQSFERGGCSVEITEQDFQVIPDGRFHRLRQVQFGSGPLKGAR